MIVSRIGKQVWRVAALPCRRETKSYFSIGRMVDLGGMPSASNDQTLIRTVNASKNSKLQAVAFDFEVLTRALEASPKPEVVANTPKPSDAPTAGSVSASSVKPDLHQVQEVASLLNVSMDTGAAEEKVITPLKKRGSNTRAGEDIRAKYAAKLQGGLSSIESAKSQVEDSLKGGDASGHLAARERAITTTAASPTKWMALTGTGKLLSYLTHRSIRLALLPNTMTRDAKKREEEFKFMKDFSTQLKEIVVDSVVPFDATKSIEHMLQKSVLEELDVHPNKVLIVSDKDNYLKAAKDMGMLTCRLRPKNARRGNVTAHYNATDVPSVQEVVNEITGISFNAVLNR